MARGKGCMRDIIKSQSESYEPVKVKEYYSVCDVERIALHAAQLVNNEADLSKCAV